MKSKRYSVEQVVAALKQHELGTPVADIARKLGVAEQTFYRWKKQYGGLEPGEVRELKQLREENTRLKRLVADLSIHVVKCEPRRRCTRRWRMHGFVFNGLSLRGPVSTAGFGEARCWRARSVCA